MGWQNEFIFRTKVNFDHKLTMANMDDTIV